MTFYHKLLLIKSRTVSNGPTDMDIIEHEHEPPKQPRKTLKGFGTIYRTF